MLGQILNLVTALRAAYTDTKAGYLDASISSRASGTNLQTVDNNVDILIARLTANRALNLDNLDAAVSGAGLPVPSALNYPTGNNTSFWFDASSAFKESFGIVTSSVSSGSSTGVYATLLSESGSGVIEFLGFYIPTGGTGSDSYQARLSIDGSVVWTGDSDTFAEGAGNNIIGSAVYGSSSYLSFSFGQVRYTTGFVLEIRNNTNSNTETWNVVSRYYET